SVLALSPAAEAAPWAACVTGAAGAGKSALFAKLVRRLQDHGDVLVLAHAAGIGPRSTQVDSMLRRWIEELAEAGGEANALREDAGAQEVEETFERLLAAVAAQRRVVVVLDALDRFEATSRARSLTWLPKVWPTNARLIATAIPGPASDTLSVRRGVTGVALPALTEA